MFFWSRNEESIRIADHDTHGIAVCVFSLCEDPGNRSEKSVAVLIASLIPLMIGNMLIIITQDHLVADIGSYMYFIGMDLIMFFLARLTTGYCDIPVNRPLLILIYVLLQQMPSRRC